MHARPSTLTTARAGERRPGPVSLATGASALACALLVAAGVVAPGGAAPASAASSPWGFFLSNRWGSVADAQIVFGDPGDHALVGDWDGDGRDTLGVRRGNVFYLSNDPASGRADVVLPYGSAADEVLVGDWDGNGTDTVGVRRGARFYLTDDLRSQVATRLVSYGDAPDEVLVGDWDGNGTDTFGVRRLDAYLLSNTLGGVAQVSFRYGDVLDVALTGDWDGDGRDSVGVRRGASYYLRNGLTPGVADRSVAYGDVTDEALVGDWDGDRADTLGVRRYPGAPYASSIRGVTAAELGASWRPGCPVAPDGLRNVSVRYWGYDRVARTGNLVVAAAEAPGVAAIFGDLYAAGFPIRKMYTSDLYGGSDDALVQNDNTSAFLCRTVPGSSTISQHSYGLAIDINPLVNPWVYSGGIIPIEGAAYANRNQTAPGMIQPNDVAVRAFAARGWVWGGYWTSSKDYQHFSRNGR